MPGWFTISTRRSAGTIFSSALMSSSSFDSRVISVAAFCLRSRSADHGITR